VNTLQTAANNLSTRAQLKSWNALLQAEDTSLRDDLNHLEITGSGPALEAHKEADHHSIYLTNYRGDLRYFQQTRFISTSAGAADAGKPVLLDTAGHLDPSFVELALEDHGSLSGLGDDDHTQYLLIDGSRAMSGGLGVWGATPPGSQPAKINDPAGGATQDTEARAAVAAIIDILEGAGLSAAT